MAQSVPGSRLATLLLTGAALCASVSSVSAARAPTLENLKGSYKGVFTPNGGTGGQMILKITKDKRKNGTISISGTAKLARGKTFKVMGTFETSQRQLNLAGVVGRPPQLTQLGIIARVETNATDINGNYTLLSQSGLQAGTFSVNR